MKADLMECQRLVGAMRSLGATDAEIFTLDNGLDCKSLLNECVEVYRSTDPGSCGSQVSNDDSVIGNKVTNPSNTKAHRQTAPGPRPSTVSR